MNTSHNKTIIGSIAIIFASILWGLDGVVLTPRLGNLNVTFVVFTLHFIPFIIMSLFLFKRIRHFSKLDKKAFISLIFVSILGGALGTIAIVKALFLVNFQELSIVILLQKLQPLFAILLAVILLKERITKNVLFWGIIAIIAGYFLSFGMILPHLNTNNNTLLAAGYSIFAAFSFGSSTVLSKPVLNKIDFITATYFRYGLTVLIMLPVILYYAHYLEVYKVTQLNWIIFLITALTTGSGAIMLYYYGLRNVKASVSTISELFFPISAIFFDYLINGHVLSPIQWISAGVMIFSIMRLNKGYNENLSKQKEIVSTIDTKN